MAPHEASNQAAPQTVSPWSCFNCRRRKYRCNRRHPCVHCEKSSLECTYPVSGRMPTRQHGLSGSTTSMGKREELLSRLRDLESLVERLNAEAPRDRSQMTSRNGGSCGCSCHTSLDTPSESSSEERLRPNKDRLRSSKEILCSSEENLLGDFGKLHIDDGGCLYIGNKFWSLINTEVRSVRLACEDATRNEDMFIGENVSVHEITRTPFFSGMRTHSNTTPRQPLPSQVPYLWQVFVENVDPFIKVLHVPTMEKVVRKSKGKFDSLTAGMRSLMFAICLAAISSLDDTDVQEYFNDSKDDMASWLLSNTEKALGDAGVLEMTDINAAQALVIYLEIAGQHYGTRSIWTMGGVLVRAAMSMGLHRDGSHFPNLSVFEAEMRRRLWWQICFLDNRVGQCDVPELSVNSTMFDTQEPLNVNDVDICPEMTNLPASREGVTEMSYSLASCELWRLSRKVQSIVPELLAPGKKRDELRDQALQATEMGRKKIFEVIFPSSEPETPLLGFMKFKASGLINQTLLIIKHMDLFRSPSFELPTLRRHSLATSVNALEDFHAWKHNPSAKQWSWHLLTHNQWHAVCVVLAHLRQDGPWDATAEKAWEVAIKLINETPTPMMIKNPLKHSICVMVGEVWKRREAMLAKSNDLVQQQQQQTNSSFCHTTSFQTPVGSSMSSAESHDPLEATWNWIANSQCTQRGVSDLPFWIMESTEELISTVPPLGGANRPDYQLGTREFDLSNETFTFDLMGGVTSTFDGFGGGEQAASNEMSQGGNPETINSEMINPDPEVDEVLAGLHEAC